MRHVLNEAEPDPNPKTAAPPLTPLADLRPGDTGIVRTVATGQPELRDRMRAMGLCEGRRLHVLRTGPRLIVVTMGTRIGLARELARDLLLETEPNPTPAAPQSKQP